MIQSKITPTSSKGGLLPKNILEIYRNHYFFRVQRCLKGRSDTNNTQRPKHWLLSALKHQLRCWGLCVSLTGICSRNPEFNETCSLRTSCNAVADSCLFLKKVPGKGAVGRALSQAVLPPCWAGRTFLCLQAWDSPVPKGFAPVAPTHMCPPPPSLHLDPG